MPAVPEGVEKRAARIAAELLMKVLHLASYDQRTGAAAPALEEVFALREAGVETSWAYVAGGSLDDRCRNLPFAHGILTNRQDPVSVLRATRALRRLIAAEQFDIVHAHLSHDHWLALLARKARRQFVLVRTFHSQRPLRGDPVTGAMIRRTDILCASNASLTIDSRFAERTAHLTPPPVDVSSFRPDGAREPDRPSSCRVGFIGKMAAGRGFDEAIRAFQIVRSRHPDARMTVLGDGELSDNLHRLARELDVAEAIDWAGHREHDLAAWYRGMHVLLHVATGSENGHRNAIEALACGTPIASWPLPGINEVLPGEMIAIESTREALAAVAERMRSRTNRDETAAIADRFSRQRSALRLQRIYGDSLLSSAAAGPRSLR